MFRSMLALLSTLQIGARIQRSLERSLRQVAVIGVASVFLIAGAAFGLLAAYHALVSVYLFSTIEAAAILAASLVLVGCLVLAALPLLKGKSSQASDGPLALSGEGGGLINHSLGKAMQQVGPLGVIAIAFVTGLLVSRR